MRSYIWQTARLFHKSRFSLGFLLFFFILRLSSADLPHIVALVPELVTGLVSMRLSCHMAGAQRKVYDMALARLFVVQVTYRQARYGAV